MKCLFAAVMLCAACAAGEVDRIDQGTLETVTVVTDAGPRRVEVVVKDGEVYLDDDMVLAPVAGGLRSATRYSAAARWPSGVIPYVIDASVTGINLDQVNEGIAAWQAATFYRFRAQTSETGYVRFTSFPGPCKSSVGHTGAEQTINIFGCIRGGATHEIGHAIGLYHEQARADRDRWIAVNWDNIKTDAFTQAQFKTYEERGLDGRDVYPGGFDFSSVMLYKSYNSFAIDPSIPTMTRRSDGSTWGLNDALSDNDIAGATAMHVIEPGEHGERIVNVRSGKCLDVQGAALARHAPVNQYTCHGGSNQAFFRQGVPTGSGAIIANQNSVLCLDVDDNATSGGRLQQYPCHGLANQRFILVSTGAGEWEIRQVQTGLCLDVANASTADGAIVQTYPCTGNANQRWRFETL